VKAAIAAIFGVDGVPDAIEEDAVDWGLETSRRMPCVPAEIEVSSDGAAGHDGQDAE